MPRAGVDGREVRRGEVLGEDDRLDRQGAGAVALGQPDEQLDVEGLVERRHLRQHRGERRRVEGLEPGLGVEHVRQRRDEHHPDEVPEQDDDLVRLVAGAARLDRGPVGAHEDGAVHPVPLAERADHPVTGDDRRRQRAELGQVRRQVGVGVADDVPAGPVRARRRGRDGGRQPGEDRPALARLVGRGQPVERRADAAAGGDDVGQPQHRHAAVAAGRVALGRGDVRHQVGAGGPVRAAVVDGDDAPGDAGQAGGQPVELGDLRPDEVLPVRVLGAGDHAAGLAVHRPHHGQVHRLGELGQPPPRPRRGGRLGGHRGPVAGGEALGVRPPGQARIAASSTAWFCSGSVRSRMITGVWPIAAECYGPAGSRA